MSEVIFGGKKALGCQLRNRKRAGKGVLARRLAQEPLCLGQPVPNLPQIPEDGFPWGQVGPVARRSPRLQASSSCRAAPAGQLQQAELSGVLLTPSGPPASEAQVSLALMLEHRTQSTGTAPGL